MHFISGLKLKDAPISEAQKREDLSSANRTSCSFRGETSGKQPDVELKPTPTAGVHSWGYHV